MKYHGFPSKEKLNSGSKLSLFPAKNLNIAAGLFSENVGTRLMPLLVKRAEPDKKKLLLVLSADGTIVLGRTVVLLES